MSPASPSVPVYSTWNTSHNYGSAVYAFDIATQADKRSSIRIKIYENITGKLLSESFHKPYKIGTFNVDVSSFVRPYLYTEWVNFSERNKADIGGSIRFYITWQQIQEDETEGVTYSESDRPIFLLRSVMQYGSATGSNLSAFIPFPDPGYAGKFLTIFNQPRKWRGYKRTVSFLWDTYMRANQIEAEQVELNINGLQLTSNEESLDFSQFNKVNTLKVLDPTESNTKYIDLTLNLGSEVNNTYVDSGYVDNGYQTIE
jgi:hypothetical protein